MSALVIYAVVEVPIDVNSKICSTNVTDPSVYHCGKNEYGSAQQCNDGYWCFAKWTYPLSSPVCSCVPAANIPATQGTQPNPYNWMAGLVTVPSGTSGPTVTLPAVNGNLPHNLLPNTLTVFTNNKNNNFVDYADQTPDQLVNGNPGPGYLIVVYDYSWFQSQDDINAFTSNPIWLNYSVNTYTYNGASIPSFVTQFTSAPAPGGGSGGNPSPPAGPTNKTNHSYLIWILVVFIVIAIIAFIVGIIVYNKNKNKK